MQISLKVLHGKLKSKDGVVAVQEVPITRSRFVIGTASDCHMRCPSSTLSPHHCEIGVRDGQVRLRDLDSEQGTFVNDQRVDAERLLQHGDRLRVGRLEFELFIERPQSDTKADPVDDFVSDMLVEADEAERVTRLADPRLRQFQVDPNQPHDAPPAESEPADKLAALRKKVPTKRPPGKLPPPPSITADSTISAAEQTLKKIFEKPKPKQPKY